MIMMMMRARGHQSAPGSHQSARVIAPADTNPPRAATNPLAYARPRTPIRTGQPPIRSRMRARGHQSATGSHQSVRVCAPADTNPARAATNPLAYARPRTPIRPGQPPIRSRMRAGGHQSAPDSHQSARVCAPARALGKGCPGERMPVPGKPFRFVGTALLAGKPFLTRRRGNRLGIFQLPGQPF